MMKTMIRTVTSSIGSAASRFVGSKLVGSKLVGSKTAVVKSSVVALMFGASVVVATSAFAASGGFALETPLIDTSNQKSLQRGAKAYVNYCMGCHTADYQRYSRLASDLGLDELDVSENLIFTTDKAGEKTKVGSLMFNNMTTDYGRQAFGVVPPNLALTARSRGEDWIYTYLKTFYRDESRGGVGVNNLVYPGAAMPHVLWEQQGWAEPIYEGEGADRHIVGLSEPTGGTMTPAQYDGLITDLTAFMSYMADPIKHTRHRIGMFVMLFLLVLTVISYFLKKEYWKDVV